MGINHVASLTSRGTLVYDANHVYERVYFTPDFTTSAKNPPHKGTFLSMPTLILEEDHDLPLCRIQITLRYGATQDLEIFRLPGVAHFTTELMRRGAGGKSRAQLDAALDQMGASLTVHCGHDSAVFDLLFVKQYLSSALPLLADVLLHPHLEEGEAAHLRDELLADIDESCEDDSHLNNHFFAKALHGNHPYAYPVEGTRLSIPLLNTAQARAWYQRFVQPQYAIVGVAGDLSAAEWHTQAERYLGRSWVETHEEKPPLVTKTPTPTQGMVWLVDKPARTQSQILLGQWGPLWGSPAFLPLHVATTTFGGTFTSRLMQEVRAKRGLSYGASAHLSHGRELSSLVAHVFPAAEQTAETLELVLRLYQEWATEGLRTEEAEFTKQYLASSHAFSIQTPEGRLRRRTQLELCGLSQERLLTFPERVRAVTHPQINDTLQQWLTPNELAISIVGTASFLEPQLRKIPMLSKTPIHVIPYDNDDVFWQPS